MEYAFILFILMSIGYTVLWVGGKIFRRKKPKQQHINPYIAYHQAKLKNDRDYEAYLDFCAKNGEAPMEKAGFDQIRKKERAIERLFR